MRYLLLLLTLFLLLQGCVTKKQCARRFPCTESINSTDSTHIKDSVIKAKEAKAQLQVSIDSLKKLVQDLPIKITDSTSQATITITRDQYNNLLIECTSKPDPEIVRNIEYRYKTKEVIKYIDKPVNVEVEVIKYKTHPAAWYTILILFALLILSNLKRLFRLIKPI
ncbi:MAG: hypothetical protein ACXWW0_00080 [Bacteroidia bacterium]